MPQELHLSISTEVMNHKIGYLPDILLILLLTRIVIVVNL